MAFAVDERLAGGILAYCPVELFAPDVEQVVIVKEMSAEGGCLPSREDDGFVAVEDAEPHGKAPDVMAVIDSYTFSQLHVEEGMRIVGSPEVQSPETVFVSIFTCLVDATGYHAVRFGIGGQTL